MIRTKEDGKPSLFAKLRDQQLNGSSFKGKRYARYEVDPYNTYQNFLYNRALYGLTVYSPEELKEIRWSKKERIIKVHKRAQKVLNIWKQEITNQLCNHLFRTVFSYSCDREKLVGDETDEEFINTIPFRLLNISKTQIVEKLIKEGILPHNFNQLNSETCI